MRQVAAKLFSRTAHGKRDTSSFQLSRIFRTISHEDKHRLLVELALQPQDGLTLEVLAREIYLCALHECRGPEFGELPRANHERLTLAGASMDMVRPERHFATYGELPMLGLPLILSEATDPQLLRELEALPVIPLFARLARSAWPQYVRESLQARGSARVLLPELESEPDRPNTFRRPRLELFGWRAPESTTDWQVFSAIELTALTLPAHADGLFYAELDEQRQTLCVSGLAIQADNERCLWGIEERMHRVRLTTPAIRSHYGALDFHAPGEDIEVQLLGTALLARHALLALWEDNDGPLGWTWEASAAIPATARYTRDQLELTGRAFASDIEKLARAVDRSITSAPGFDH